MKEETLLFPYIVAAAACREKGDDEPGACFGAVQNPIRQMEHEHDAAGELLRRIRATSLTAITCRRTPARRSPRLTMNSGN